MTEATVRSRSTEIAPDRSTFGMTPVRSRMVDGMLSVHGPPSRYTETASPSCFSASSALVAGDWPCRLALDTASGPVCLSTSRVTACSGIRRATVPLVSPRSHSSVGLARNTRVSAPGQNSSIRSCPNAPRSSTRAAAARAVPTSTGGGMPLPRPLAASMVVTAEGVNASTPMPYTVSVGSTISSPPRAAVTAASIPAVRENGSRQSKRMLIRLPRLLLGQSPGRGDETVTPGQVLVVARVPPAGLLGEHPVHRRPLRCAVLDGDQTARAQQPPGRAFHGPDGVEPVRSAPQGRRRVVLADLGLDVRPHRDVRRVADHEVNRTVEVAERVGEVAPVQHDAARRIGNALHVLADVTLGPGPGERVGLDRVHPGPRNLLADRQRDRARAGAQVSHHRLGDVHLAQPG